MFLQPEFIIYWASPHCLSVFYRHSQAGKLAGQGSDMMKAKFHHFICLTFMIQAIHCAEQNLT
jgi:hypothetical protein